MTDRCPNCDKPVLATDITCWHCGYQLPARPKSQAGTKKRSAGVGLWRSRPAEDTPVDFDFRMLVVYGLLTLAIIVALWLVMSALSSRPILVQSAGLGLDGDSVLVTDNDLRYTLAFPADWQWIDASFRDQDERLGRVIGRQTYVERALDPLGRAAGDVEIIGLAIDSLNPDETDPQTFVVIGRSDRLREVEPRAALDLLDAQPLPVTEEYINTRLAGQPQARFNILDRDGAYQCRHLFVSDAVQPAYVIAACAPQSRFGTTQRLLDEILDSFQLLEH